MKDHPLSKAANWIKQITDYDSTEIKTPTNKLFWDPMEVVVSVRSQEMKMNKDYALIVMSFVDPMGYKQLMQERASRRQNIQDKWNARCLSRRLRSELNNSGVTCVKTCRSKL